MNQAVCLLYPAPVIKKKKPRWEIYKCAALRWASGRAGLPAVGETYRCGAAEDTMRKSDASKLHLDAVALQWELIYTKHPVTNFFVNFSPDFLGFRVILVRVFFKLCPLLTA